MLENKPAEQQTPNKQESIDNFEEQFNRKEFFDFLGEEIEVVDVSPDSLKTEVPVIIAPGWGESPETLKESIRELFKSGHRVISLTHLRVGGDINDKNDGHTAELRKAGAIQTVLKNKGIKEIDAVAHSEGAINIALAALSSTNSESEQVGLFRNIVLVSPGGLVGKNSFFNLKLLTRFASETIKNVAHGLTHRPVQKQALKSLRDLIVYINKNPFRATDEAISISESDIRETLKTLHDKGVGISVIHGADDAVFPMDSMQKQLGNSKIIDGFYSVKGGHYEISKHPKVYTHLIDSALGALEKKHSNS